MNPEEVARQQIDAMLTASGWAIQDYKALNLSAARGIAVREVPLKSGRCDYLLLVDRIPVGVVEAKKEGTTLSTVADQSGHYAENLPDFLAALTPGKLRFLYESTGVETFFRDELDPHHRSRQVFSFHRPESLAEYLAEAETLRARLRTLPPLSTSGMRDCQVEAITRLDESFREARPRALIQMATGAGKTFTACAFTYRLIKHAGAKRVLFLVDRANLGRQAMAEFQQFVTPDGRKFTELYNVQHLTSNKLDPVCRVVICTIQRLYSMLRGEELDEDLDEKSGYEIATADDRPKDVAYNAAIPIEFFDFIVTDECHRSIYNLWRQVLEYFDAFLIGLTATPSKQTIGFFNQNLVTEYNHERAVADGVNVGYEVYRIKTQVTEQGGKIEKGFYIDRRCKETRRVRWERLDEDLTFTARELDRSIVVKSQIRTVINAFKDALFTDLFPGRTLVPKTLIFAKDDSHAEDIVHLVREVFGRGNDFAKKITYKSWNPETKRNEKSEHLIAEFRTSPQLRIAVTVDMIATGTDIKPLECLLFLRDVRSRVYFEQMKGRGTRVLSPTDLQAVSGADARAKTHFVIVDAVGVCESDKTDSRPLEKKPTVAFDALLLGVALGKRDEDTLTTLAGRLARMERELDESGKQEVRKLTGGQSLGQMSAGLLRALDPDVIAERATGKPGAAPQEVEPALFEKTKQQLALEACAPFDKPEVRDALVRLRQQNEQTIDHVTIDKVLSQQFDAAAKEKAESLIKTFRDYIEQHRAEIEALQILYSRPFKQRLTEEGLKELEAKLKQEPQFGPDPIARIWGAFEKVEAASSRSSSINKRQDAASTLFQAFDRNEPIANLSGILPHWRQAGTTYFVTFRTADSLPEEKLAQWQAERTEWLRTHPESHTDADRRDYYERFPERLQYWLDQGNGACLLARPELKKIVEDALRHFHGERYDLGEFIVMPNHVHALVTPLNEHELSSILHSWKSYTATQINKRLGQSGAFWQKESFDHIVRSPASLEKFAEYIRDNPKKVEATSSRLPSTSKRQDAASTLRRFTDLVSLVRFALVQEPVLEPFEEHVQQRFAAWLETQRADGIEFTGDQLAWLEKMRDYISASGSVDRDHLEADNVLGPIYRAFGERLWPLMEELNLTLAA